MSEVNGINKGPLVSIEEHEQRMDHRRQLAKREADHTHVACRRCMTEYKFADDLICASCPPKRWVVCPNPDCGDRTTITI